MQSYSALIIHIIFLILFFIGAIFLTAFNISILKLGKFQTKETLKFTLFFWNQFFLKNKWENFYIIISITKHVLYLLYGISAFLFLNNLFSKIQIRQSLSTFYIFLIIIFFFLAIDFIIRLFTRNYPKIILKITAPLCAIYISIFLMITFPFLILMKLSFKSLKKPKDQKFSIAKDKVLEMIKDSELSTFLSENDQNSIASFITFKEKVAREIMIPRIDIFALDVNTTIKEAAKQLLEENYSRIPVYKENLDNIIGTLMYKDLLTLYSKNENINELQSQTIKSLIKPIIYTPENKKIYKLLQEFKNKKIHLSIVVNEYGGTEGVVSIEDIIEEVVGEIKDEYDITEEKQFWKLPSGSILVDAKMSIIDIEKELKIKIPYSSEYETIGGYIFHIAGTIPSKGWKIHLEDFEIEVLISNERYIEKIKIKPTTNLKLT